MIIVIILYCILNPCLIKKVAIYVIQQIIINKTTAMLPKNGAANKFSVQKMETLYIENLQSLIKVFSQIISHLCDEDSIENSTINELSQLFTQLKYTQKMKNEQSPSKQLNKYVQSALLALKTKQQQFPRIKPMKSQNYSQLATIAQKYSEQNILSNYLRKNSHHRSNPYSNPKYTNNLSELEHYSETLHLGSEVNREETRRSLDSSYQKQKKPLYKQLQKIKPKETQVTAYKMYQEPKKFNVKSKLPQYTISKLI